jgi:uncharacterized protein (DUF983 family)
MACRKCGAMLKLAKLNDTEEQVVVAVVCSLFTLSATHMSFALGDVMFTAADGRDDGGYHQR